MYLVVLLPVIAQQRSPTEMARQAARLEKQGKIVEAYLLYSQAAAADPDATSYWLKAQALRTRAAIAAKVMPGAAESTVTESVESPGDGGGPAITAPTEQELKQAREPQPPPILDAAPGLKSFSVTADSKALWEQVAKTLGLDVIFDADFRSTPNIRFHLENVDYRDALYALQNATGTFVVPITSKVILVVNDNPQKRAEQEMHVTVLIPIPDPVTLQDAQDMTRSVQQVMEIQRFGLDTAHRVVFFRDRQSKVRPAEELLLQLMTRRPEVMLEVDLLTVSKNSTLSFGIPIATSATLTPRISAVSIPRALQLFTRLNVLSQNYLIGVGVLSTQLLATLEKSTVENVFHTELRAEDAFPATLHIGDKYPVVTANYTVPTGTTGASLPSSPVFNFEDLGLKLKVTPRVHGTEAVTLDIEAEYRVLTGETVNDIPIISTRNIKDTARLTFGEWAAIAGLVSNQEARSLAGVAGISQIPILGPLLSKNTKQNTDTETLLIIKPHLLSTPPTETITQPIWIGPEGRMRIPI